MIHNAAAAFTPEEDGLWTVLALIRIGPPRPRSTFSSGVGNAELAMYAQNKPNPS